MTNLESMQKNTSEFNISYHLADCAAAAIMNCFLDDENREMIEDALKLKCEPLLPYQASLLAIHMMLLDFIKTYLAIEREE